MGIYDGNIGQDYNLKVAGDLLWMKNLFYFWHLKKIYIDESKTAEGHFWTCKLKTFPFEIKTSSQLHVQE